MIWKDKALVISGILLLILALSTQYYQKRAVAFEKRFKDVQLKLKIERNEPKLKNNFHMIVDLEKQLQEEYKKYESLHSEYKLFKINRLKNLKKELKDVNTTKDICNKFSSLGYNICNIVSSPCK